MAGFRFLVFSLRNDDKWMSSFANDKSYDPHSGAPQNVDHLRVLPALGQTYNSAKAGLFSEHAPDKVVKKATEYVDKLETATKKSSVLGTTAKGVKVISQNVNPLLCVASAWRVTQDDEWQKGAVEEGLAMTSMFAAERLSKIARMYMGDPEQISKITDVAKKAKLENANTLFKNIKNPKARLATSIIMDIGFVIASLTGFSLGKKLGQCITGREDTKPIFSNPFNSSDTDSGTKADPLPT